MKKTIAVLMLALSLTACGGGGVSDVPNSNEVDSEMTRVFEDWRIYKACDGTTLVYAMANGGISVIENSPECKR